MKLSIERRRPYNFNVAITVGIVGVSFSFINCIIDIFRILDISSFHLYRSFSLILLNLFTLGCAIFLVCNYKRFKLISGACLVFIALVLICIFKNYYSGLIILLSGFFGIMESMLKKGNVDKGYSYFGMQNTIFESRRQFRFFMPEI